MCFLYQNAQFVPLRSEQQNAIESGEDLMEITAHYGARPSHEVWQGKIVSLSGKAGYLSLSDIGYGTGAGFKGWNCRHDWFVFYEDSPRMYSDERIKELNSKTVEYNGKTYTEYEAQQRQRAMERKIRATRTELAGYDEAINNTADESLKADLQNSFNSNSVKLKGYEAKYKDFCNKTERYQDKFRLQKQGFNKSVSQKAVWHAKKTANTLKNKNESAILKKTEILENIRNGKYNLSLNIGNQNKHIASSHSYKESDKKSILYGDLDTAQQLVNKYSGTGIVKLSDKGEWVNKEFVTADNDIGETWNEEKYFSTNRFAIHYGKKGTHVVPVRRE